MVEFGGFGILADGRPKRFGGRTFDVLMALIEASRAVVSKYEVWAASGKAGSSTRSANRAQNCRAPRERTLVPHCIGWRI